MFKKINTDVDQVYVNEPTCTWYRCVDILHRVRHHHRHDGRTFAGDVSVLLWTQRGRDAHRRRRHVVSLLVHRWFRCRVVTIEQLLVGQVRTEEAERPTCILPYSVLSRRLSSIIIPHLRPIHPFCQRFCSILCAGMCPTLSMPYVAKLREASRVLDWMRIAGGDAMTNGQI